MVLTIKTRNRPIPQVTDCTFLRPVGGLKSGGRKGLIDNVAPPSNRESRISHPLPAPEPIHALNPGGMHAPVMNLVRSDCSWMGYTVFKPMALSCSGTFSFRWALGGCVCRLP